MDALLAVVSIVLCYGFLCLTKLILVSFLGCIACTRCISRLCGCVCVMVTWMYFAQTTELIEMQFGADSYGPKEPLLDGVEIPHGQEQFLGLFCPLKSIGSLCCGVCSKRDHSVFNNGMTECLLHLDVTLHCLLWKPVPSCDAVFCQNSFSTFQCMHCTSCVFCTVECTNVCCSCATGDAASVISTAACYSSHDAFTVNPERIR